MALVSCPECEKLISDTTPTCPHCGYRLSTEAPSASQSLPTEIGALEKNTPTGAIKIVGGIAIILISIPFIGVFGLGIFSMIGGFLLFSMGYMNITGLHNVTCPHCKTAGHMTCSAQNYKCPTCKKLSVRKANYLEPIS